MKVRNEQITAEMQVYAEAVEKAGAHSTANPSCAVKDNPFVKDADRAHRKALGSVRVMMICPGCNHVTPRIKDLRTACCGSQTVRLHDHR
jgi:hypothetical protein